jgi:hypothetical protein
MVVVPVDGFQMPGVLVFGRHRVVPAHADHLGHTCRRRLWDGPSHQERTQRLPQVVGVPGTDASAVGHVRRIDRLDKLSMQVGQRFACLAHQDRLGQVDDMTPLPLGRLQGQLVDERAYLPGVV